MKRATDVLLGAPELPFAGVEPRPSAALSRRTWAAAAVAVGALLAVAYGALFWSLDALPFQDVPNHLSRAFILADLLFHGGERFGGAFTLRLQPAPYLLGDLALAGLVERLGPYAAGRLWVIATWASLPASVAAYLRLRRYRPASIAVGTVVAFYLATDWTFMTGFQAYRLSVAETLLALGAWERFLESGRRRWWLAYAACVAIGYLTHLSAVLMTGVAAGVTGLVALGGRRAPFLRVASGAVPLLAAVGWEVASAHGAVAPGVALYDPWWVKLKRTVSLFHRYEYPWDGALCAIFAGIVALLGRGARGRWRRSARALPALALAAAYLALYYASPMSHGYVSWIDCRALPFVPLFALFAALALGEEMGREARRALALALVLAAGNVALLRAHLVPNNQHMRELRELCAEVPRGTVFLPIPTRRNDHATDPFLHFGSFATIEAGAVTPYLFAGGVTRYLERRGWKRIVPSEFWYQEQRGGPFLGWEMTVAGWFYPYLLWEKPFDPSGGPFVPVRLVAENGAGALYRIAW